MVVVPDPSQLNVSRESAAFARAEFRRRRLTQGLWNKGEAQVFALLLMEGFARFALYLLSTSLVPFRVQVVVFRPVVVFGLVVLS